MDYLIDIIKRVADLQQQLKDGITVSDMQVDTLMHIIEKEHGKYTDNNTLLDNQQKNRRKQLYSDAVRAMSKYCKQVCRDEENIRRKGECLDRKK